MKIIFYSLTVLFLTISCLVYGDFTVCSYNCGGLTDHYDYFRAACMQKIMQERCHEQPEVLYQLELIQNTALKILFSEDPEAKNRFEKENYSEILREIVEAEETQAWSLKLDQMLSSYQVRPVVLNDQDVEARLKSHVEAMTHKPCEALNNEMLDLTRKVMAKHIFYYDLRYDLIALQEVDYLDPSLFPENYAYVATTAKHSVNAIAYNKNKFELIENLGNFHNKGLALLFKDLESNKTVLIITAHLKGCHPFFVENDDAKWGDKQLKSMLTLAQNTEADYKVIAMDSNVAATHPRMSLLKEAGFILDDQKYLGPTCSNPGLVFDTRIDWIAIQGGAISNLDVKNVHLNCLETNISDHKPIAAKID